MHPGRTPRRLPGANQRPPHAGGEFWILVWVLTADIWLHGPDFTRVGGRLELQYTAHASAIGRYVFWRLDQLREKRPSTSAFVRRSISFNTSRAAVAAASSGFSGGETRADQISV